LIAAMGKPIAQRPLFDEADDRGPFEDRTPTHVKKVLPLSKTPSEIEVRTA